MLTRCLFLPLAAVAVLRSAAAAELVCDFATALDAAAWETQVGGDAKVSVADGRLTLDLSTPRQGKFAWVSPRRVIKLPATIEWDQQLVQDSPHCYLTGLELRDVAGRVLRVGLAGTPLGHAAYLGARRSPLALDAGRWYRLRLELDTGRAATLVLMAVDTGAELWRAQSSGAELSSGFCRLTFFHNQAPDDGADRYDQGRGISAFRRFRATASSLSPGALADYRDAELRGFDPRTPMAFNRATVWLGEAEGVSGSVLAYDRARDLPLTGEQQVASWTANRLCTVRNTGPRTSEFERPNDLDGDDVAAVRSFQWCISQHPVLDYVLRPEGTVCWLRVTLVCPYLGAGIEIFRTQPRADPLFGAVDLLPLFARRGLGYHQFQEIGVYLYQGRPADPKAPAGRVEFSLRLVGTGALVTTPAVVRCRDRAAAGVDVCALFAGADGQPRHRDQVSLTAELAGQRLALTEQRDTGVFSVTLRDLPLGEYAVRLAGHEPATGRTLTRTTTVTVTDGDFAAWTPGTPTYRLRSGRVLPTLLGDLYAWVPMLEPASEPRRLVLTADQWRSLSAAEQARVGLVKLRTLTEAEIAAQLESHWRNGIRVIRLAPNVSPVEAYLDAGGHVSLQGLETLGVVLRECRRLGLRALINLFHYPYGSPGTGAYPPWVQYAEAGYRGVESFTSAEIEPRLRQYLAELLLVLRDDPAVLGYSLTGENDPAYGAEWLNRMFEFVRQCDPNHLVTLEQGGGPQHCAGGQPWGYDAFAPGKSGGLGYRTYYTEGMRSDAYFLASGRFYRANAPCFLAEVASGPGWYGGFARDWTHPDFLTKVRDNCWASLLTQHTMCLTWSAPWTQEERLIPELCTRQIDWDRFRRVQPPVGLQVKPLGKSGLQRLAEYEAALARVGLDYDCLWEGHSSGPPAESYRVRLDAGAEFVEPRLDPAVLALRPVVAVQGEYSLSYLLGAEPVQLLAWVRNTAEYKLGPGYGQGVQELHRQRAKPSRLLLSFCGLPADCVWRVYDLDQRCLVREGRVGAAPDLDLGETAHDYAVVATDGQSDRARE